MANIESTVALSLIIHGEAVRLNRGKAQADGYDFKFMSGHGKIFPYVSSQCFKKYWRESLPEPYSPITRGKNAAGAEKNQVYTDGNPVLYVDDDLFGYMRAGASSEGSEDTVAQDEDVSPDQADAEIESYLLDRDMIKDPIAFVKQFKSGKKAIYSNLQSNVPDDLQEEYNRSKGDISDALLDALLYAINQAIQNPSDSGYEMTNPEKKAVKEGKKTNSQVVYEFLAKDFAKALQPKLPTTKRTSPIRMHALVAFSAISMAKDFQTFARDIAYSGKNAVLNPNPVGIYSGWLKTRILIEGCRIGKFYLGENRDMLPEQLTEGVQGSPEISKEHDPYSRDTKKQVEYVQLSVEERTNRVRQALLALANIGNQQGPASGALHDGSLRPKGFVGAFMNCADSPFDAVWEGTDELPIFNYSKLRAMLLDWQDLFASQVIYIGYPVEMKFTPEQLKETLLGSAMQDIADLGFTFVVDTPRRALLKMAEDIAG